MGSLYASLLVYVSFWGSFILSFFVSGKNVIGSLIGIVLNVLIAFGDMSAFTLILPVCELGKCFHLLVTFSFTLFSVFNF